MTFRVHPTPLDALMAMPDPREGSLADGLLDAIVPAPGLEAQRARLAAPGALAVTTGQQPGLFTGPLYTIHKALSAAALARQLEHRWGRPVVPVFWIAGDDHDFAEGSEATWPGSDGEPVTVRLRERPADAPLTPMFREPVGDEVIPLLEQLEAALPPSEFRPETMEWLRRHYTSEATLSGAFGGALAELLAPYGILCLDATHAAVKRAAAPVLLRALDAAASLDQDLARLRDSREADDLDVAVHLGDGAALVFLEDRLGRDRLVIDGDGFATRRGGDRHTREALERIAHEAPERLSPNVLLRPVVEAAILPTVAYLAGPGELRYFPLTVPVYERLGVTRQLPLPRWSGLLVETKIDRVLEKFHATLEELLASGGALEARVARDALPEDLLQEFVALRRAMEQHYEAIHAGAMAIDPTLEKPVGAARHHALKGAEDVEKKVLAHQKKRSSIELAQIARARAALLPGGKPQERVLTVAPLLARYGRELLARLSAEVEAWYAAALDRV